MPNRSLFVLKVKLKGDPVSEKLSQSLYVVIVYMHARHIQRTERVSVTPYVTLHVQVQREERPVVVYRCLLVSSDLILLQK